MDEAYRTALRAWQATPHDLDLVAGLFALARRTETPLPPELDVRSAFLAHAERVQETYTLLNDGGYGHFAGGRFLDAEPPFSDLAGLQSSITSMSNSEGCADQGSIVYPCLAVHEVSEIESIPCGHNTNWGGADPEPIASGFQRFEESIVTLRATFPGLRVFGISADYPDDGQVYWEQSYLLWLPYFPQSFLCVMQYVW